jgi:tetratricopeptide (TPR) repeat protein
LCRSSVGRSHAEYGDDPFQALVLLERVGDRAAARGDDLGAALVLRRGLERARRELGRGEIDEPERAIAIFARKLGDALVRAGEAAEAEGVLREALELVPWTDIECAKQQGALARALYARGRQPDAMRAIDEAVKAARRLGNRAVAVELTMTRAELESASGNANEAVLQLRAADELLREAILASTQTISHARRGGVIDTSSEIALTKMRAEVLLRLARALRIAGDEHGAAEPLVEAREIADRLGLLAERMRCEAEGAERAECLGDLRIAGAAWRRAADRALELGDAVHQTLYLEREARLGAPVRLVGA